MTTETFQVPGTRRSRFDGTYNYSLRTLIPHIIKHYASGYPEHVQERMIRASQKTPMYSGLITKIQRLNWQIVSSEVRIRITSEIRIPTAYEFFSSFFPTIDLTIERRGTIRLKTCANGVLDQFHYAIELENIVGNPERTFEFAGLTEDSQMLIRDAFHTLRIYTSPNNSETDRIQDAIRVFEEEYMQRLPDYRTGMIDSELLMEMNAALPEDGWRRDPYFSGVHENPPHDTRYFLRQGVIPITPRYNQQATHYFGATPGDWGDETTIGSTEYLMSAAGCAVALVANIIVTQREREASPPLGVMAITPLQIATTNEYFDIDGLIDWPMPLRAHWPSLVFKDIRSVLTATDFNNLMNHPTNQHYIAGHVFISGATNTHTRGSHWVGISELVVRNASNPATGVVAPALFYRISPTSQNDWRPGVAMSDVITNHRNARGWQRHPNDTNPTDVFIPVNAVRGYRLFSIAQN